MTTEPYPRFIPLGIPRGCPGRDLPYQAMPYPIHNQPPLNSPKPLVSNVANESHVTKRARRAKAMDVDE